jgi:putative ABC transport system substrate-binding protein
VRTRDEIPVKVEAAVKAGATALTVLETPVLLGLRRQIVDLEIRLRLLAIYTSRDFVDVGGLMSYAADRRQQYRRAAELVAKILEGERPADIPVEQPTKFELIINLKTAKVLGIGIPLNLLATADEVGKPGCLSVRVLAFNLIGGRHAAHQVDRTFHRTVGRTNTEREADSLLGC